MHHGEVGLLSEDLRQVRPQPSGRRTGVELRLDDDLAADDVQRTAETQHGRGLRFAAARLRDLELVEFVLDGGGHGHAPILTRGDTPGQVNLQIVPAAVS